MADRRLRVFYTVVKSGSFTRAAEKLGMTQPAVTFQIKQLEEHFDTTLIDRSHRKLRLTPAGEIVFAYAERMILLDDELETRISELTQELRGPLTIGCSTTLAAFWAPRLIEEFKRRHPNVIPRLIVGNSELTQSRVANRELDMGMIEIVADDPHIEEIPAGHDELWAIFAPAHPLAKSGKKRVTAQDLAQYPFIQRDPGNAIRELSEQFFEQAGIDPATLNIAAEMGTLAGVKHLAAAGIGVAIASRAALLEEIRAADLRALPLDPPLHTPFVIIMPKDKFRSRKITVFAEFAKERLKAMERSLPKAEFFFGP